MKKITLYLILSACFFADANAQNIFPSSGPVGIGTASPVVPLEVVGVPVWTTSFWRKAIKLRAGDAMQLSTGGGQHFGMGATTPNGLYFFSSSAEDASSTSDYRMVIKADGQVGIGTITPAAQLDVFGTFRLGIGSGSGGQAYCIGYTRPGGNAQVFSETADGLQLGGDVNGIDMTIRPNGNVGIGEYNPQSKLAVNGTITAQKVKVTMNGWSDYVFDDDYRLPSLAEMETYIRQHKHLQDVPSAQEVETNGIDVGEMSKILLKKMEELTLHVIELGKQNEALKAEVKTLKEKIR